MTPLVTSEWLARELGKPDLIVFDASFYLPAESKDAREEFRRAHIPGARYFDINLVADPETDLPHMLPSQGRFARLVGEMGVSNDHRVVFYDQKGIFSSPRGWWLFRLFGHDQVAVLDGGLPRWVSEGRAVETGEGAPAQPASFRPSFRTSLLRGLEDMRRNAQTGAELVLDARSRERFDGTAAEPRPGLLSGHMPGSRSLPFAEVLTEDKTFKTPEQLRQIFSAAGVKEGRSIACTCGSGVSATVLALGLAIAGLPDGAVYDGSWTEWASQPDTPIEPGRPL